MCLHQQSSAILGVQTHFSNQQSKLSRLKISNAKIPTTLLALKINCTHTLIVFHVPGDFNQANLKTVFPRLHQHIRCKTRDVGITDQVYTNITVAVSYTLPPPWPARPSFCDSYFCTLIVVNKPTVWIISEPLCYLYIFKVTALAWLPPTCTTSQAQLATGG